MPRPSPLSFRRARLPEWTLKGLTDPAQPDFQPIDWTLRRLDPVAQSSVSSIAAAFLEDYGENGLPTVAEEALPVTEDAAREAVAVHAMQVRLRVTGEEEDLALYSLEEVYAMLPTLPDAWERVQLVALVLQRGEVPAMLRGRVEAEGPEFVALAERLGCIPKRGAEGGGDRGNASGGTESIPSP
jgi:hypothetical protein